VSGLIVSVAGLITYLVSGGDDDRSFTCRHGAACQARAHRCLAIAQREQPPAGTEPHDV